MTSGRAVIVNSAVWAVWGTAVGWTAARLPDARLSEDGFLTRIRPWERNGRAWERLGVRRWKDRLPELGALFGGMRKQRLAKPDTDSLRQLAVETRRAELVHWTVPLAVIVMPLWSPAPVTAVMTLYAVAANVPCVIVQRYNRARVDRLLDGGRQETFDSWTEEEERTEPVGVR